MEGEQESKFNFIDSKKWLLINYLAAFLFSLASGYLFDYDGVLCKNHFNAINKDLSLKDSVKF